MVSVLPALVCLFAQTAAPTTPEPPPPAVPPAPAAPALVQPAESEPESAPLFHESGNDAFGDAPLSGFSLRTLTQVRYRGTLTPTAAQPDELATAKDNDGWRLNRMFLRLVAAPNKRVQARVLVDFA